MSVDSPSSRPSKTDRADVESGRVSQSVAGIPLTDRDGVTIRAEVAEADENGIDALGWKRAVGRWRDYIRDTGEASPVFENPEGEQVVGSDMNRFMPEYADKQYAKLKDLERGIRQDYQTPYTAMLTLTASSTDDDGEQLPPVDHLDGLLESWEAVRRSMHRELEGRKWEYLAILEPHKSGYIHVHIAVFVDGYVRRETFAPAIDAHLRNCDLAGGEAHSVEDGTSVSVHEVGDDRDRDDDLENLGTYLAEYLGTYGDDPLDAPDHQQAANAVLWATGRQRWRPSNGAQEYMATKRSESVSEWRFAGIEDGEGEIHEACSGGGVSRLTTCTDDQPPPDPPPTEREQVGLTEFA